MRAKQNWTETKQRFEAWWKGDLSESPLTCLVIKGEEPSEPLENDDWTFSPDRPGDLKYKRTDVDALLARYRNFMRTRVFLADSYPAMSLDLGPGSMALYLGSEPKFAEDTVWYTECVHNTWEDFPLVYNKDNYWWTLHYNMLKKAKENSQGEFLINIPDIVENIDILAAMRGATDICFDLIDEPALIKQRLNELDDLYFKYYNPLYKLLKDDQGGSSFTAFKVWGPGKTAKVQCDFSALMSPEQFKEFIKPSLKKQCDALDYSIFHLDGPDAIKHLPALMEIEPLRALQFTSGEGQPDSGSDKWYPLYDKVREAGKSLWIYVDGDSYAIIEKARRLVKRYGINALYLLFPPTDRASGEMILKAASNGFK